MFEKAFEKVVLIEGGYSNHKNDSGGKTRYGITEETARSFGYRGPMIALPLQTAKHIYKKMFWDTLSLDNISVLSPSIADELFDTAVNQGTGKAAEYLQVCLNAFNRQEVDYKDLKVDKQIGRATLLALTKLLEKRGSKGELVLLRSLNCLQGAFYLNLVNKRVKDEDFVFGWILNRVVI